MYFILALNEVWIQLLHLLHHFNDHKLQVPCCFNFLKYFNPENSNKMYIQEHYALATGIEKKKTKLTLSLKI